MRARTLLLAALLLVTTSVAAFPAATAQSVYCTDPKDTSATCPGTVCVDANRDGRFTYRECADTTIYCPHACPPPRDW